MKSLDNVIRVMVKESVVSYGSKEEKVFRSAFDWRDRSEKAL